MIVKATSYSSYPSENGGHHTTCLGTRLRKGVIAVDPKLIPLGTYIYVPGYGLGRAEDVGRLIKGHHIDLCMGPHKSNITRKVRISIFDKSNISLFSDVFK